MVAKTGNDAQRLGRSAVLFGLYAVAAAAALIWGAAWLLEAWLFAFVLLAGFATGGLALLMIGHLLGSYWLDPVRDELEAAALTMPFLFVLFVPVAFGLDALYPWAREGAELEIPEVRAVYLEPAFFLARGAFYLVVWTALAYWITRGGPGQRTDRRVRSAIGLALLAPTATLAAIDWVMSRDPDWWSSLFGFAFAITQLLPALAGALLITIIRPNRPDDERLRSLERALITLALLVLWLWFVQFLVIWMANLPDEVAWYLARADGWGWVMLIAVLPPLAIGVLLLLPPIVGGWLMRAAVLLLLIQHVGHMLWLVNPSLSDLETLLPGLAVAAGLAFIWVGLLVLGLKDRQATSSAIDAA